MTPSLCCGRSGPCLRLCPPGLGCAGRAQPGNTGQDELPVLYLITPIPQKGSRHAVRSRRVTSAGTSRPRSLPGCRSLMGAGWESRTSPSALCCPGAKPPLPSVVPCCDGRRSREEQQGEPGAAASLQTGLQEPVGLGSNSSRRDSWDTIPIPASAPGRAAPAGDHRVTKSLHSLGWEGL